MRRLLLFVNRALRSEQVGDCKITLANTRDVGTPLCLHCASVPWRRSLRPIREIPLPYMKEEQYDLKEWTSLGSQSDQHKQLCPYMAYTALSKHESHAEKRYRLDILI